MAFKKRTPKTVDAVKPKAPRVVEPKTAITVNHHPKNIVPGSPTLNVEPIRENEEAQWL